MAIKISNTRDDARAYVPISRLTTKLTSHTWQDSSGTKRRATPASRFTRKRRVLQSARRPQRPPRGQEPKKNSHTVFSQLSMTLTFIILKDPSWLVHIDSNGKRDITGSFAHVNRWKSIDLVPGSACLPITPTSESYYVQILSVHRVAREDCTRRFEGDHCSPVQQRCRISE